MGQLGYEKEEELGGGEIKNRGMRNDREERKRRRNDEKEKGNCIVATKDI